MNAATKKQLWDSVEEMHTAIRKLSESERKILTTKGVTNETRVLFDAQRVRRARETLDQCEALYSETGRGFSHLEHAKIRYYESLENFYFTTERYLGRDPNLGADAYECQEIDCCVENIGRK